MSGGAASPFGYAEIRPGFVPASDYVHPEVEALERNGLWPRIWHLACRMEEIPKVGDFVDYRILDESILIVRSAPDEIRAFYNVCQHRGRRLRTEARGNLGPGFHCRYHGWRYGLNGTLTFVQDEEDWAGCELDKGRLGLKAPQVGLWAGWVWVNMDPEAPPLLDWLKPIPDELEHFDLTAMRFAWHEVVHAPVNWKVVVEAFNEGYHASATHRTGSLSGGRLKVVQSSVGAHGRYDYVMRPAEASPETLRDTRSVQESIYDQNFVLYDRLRALVMEPMMTAAQRLRDETSRDTPPEELATTLWDWHREALTAAGLVWPERLTPEELTRVAGNWHIFPNTIVLPAIDGVLWYRMRPGADRDSCIFDIWCLRPFAPGTEPRIEPNVSNGFAEFIGRNSFLEEDFENLVEVNEGMKSRGWAGAVFNPVQEAHMSHFHRVLRGYLLEAAG